MLQGDALKRAVHQLTDQLRAKIEHEQGGVGTFADHALMGAVSELEQLDPSVPWDESLQRLAHSVDQLRVTHERLRLKVERRERGRYVDYATRVAETPAGVHGASDLATIDMVMSQGADDCLRWKGLPLFKTVYDFSLYPMILWALKPKTIIELGSGSGASAIWLADTAAAFGIATEIYSVDLAPPAVRADRVHFVRGDCETIDQVCDSGLLRDAAHPWLIVEDAHANVYGVLSHFHPRMHVGDYVIIEDSAGKQPELSHFLTRHPHAYAVDTYFTDFFGRNVTCAQDSILVRTHD